MDNAVIPHNIEAEQALLGAIFIDNGALHDARLIVKHPAQFYRASHQHIYKAMLELSARGAEIDWIHVAEEIARQGALDACDGRELLNAYLSEISHAVPSAYGAQGYATIVRDRWIMREVVHSCGELRETALQDNRTPDEVCGKLERKCLELSQARFSSESRDVLELLNAVLDQQQRILEWRQRGNADALPGLSSGFRDLDGFTTGWKAGELVVIGARPGEGKTSLALNIAENVALSAHERHDDGKGGVALFSLEMTGLEVAQRIHCSAARVSLSRTRMGYTNADERMALQRAAQRLAAMKLHVVDTFTMTMAEIRSTAWRLKMKHDIDCVIVDYLQLVNDDSRLDRHLQIGNISRGLKALARELQIPVIAAAQLNRNIEQRGASTGVKKRPILADLRESGSIEQDADQVILLWPRYESEPAPDTYELTLCVAKNRNGPTGDVEMVYERQWATFNAKSKAQAFAGARS